MNVSRETQKAETKLKNIAKRCENSVERTREGYAAKRRAFVAKLPLQVRRMLYAGAVIDADDLPSDTQFGGGLDDKQGSIPGTEA